MDDIDAILNNIDENSESDYESTVRKELNNDIEELSFDDDLSLPADEDANKAQTSGDDASGSVIEEEPAVPAITPIPEENEAPKVTSSPRFTIPGTKTWNTREPYTIDMRDDQLLQDVKQLQSSFYFVKEKSTDEEIKEQIRESYLKYVRRPTHTVINDYEHFIYASIIGENENASAYFGFGDETKLLFTYHCGPLTVYKMITSVFQHKKTAYCYRHESGNKSVRFYPDEYIKEKVLNWFEENIHSLNLPFDNLQNLNEIKNIVAKKYAVETKKFIQKLEAVNAKLPPERRISREKLISLKGEELFGMAAIEAYKRFMDRTIF